MSVYGEYTVQEEYYDLEEGKEEEEEEEEEDYDDDEEEEDDDELETEEEDESETDEEVPTVQKTDESALRLCLQSGRYPEFKGVEGPSSFVDPSTMVPFDMLRLIWPTALCELVANETNRYATQYNLRTNWVDVDSDEVWAFLGIVLMMGIHRLPAIRHYWSTDRLLGVPAVQNCMSRGRFWDIWSNLHLVDNSALRHVSGQSCKLKPVTDVLSQTFLEHYSPGQELSVDESMVKYTGRGTGKVKMPKKRTREGFKVWSCSSSETGYLCTFQVYDGKPIDPKTGKKFSEKGLVKRVVHDLLGSFSKLNHVVYMDNFYTSGPLADELAKKEIYMVGTIVCVNLGVSRSITRSIMSKPEDKQVNL